MRLKRGVNLKTRIVIHPIVASIIDLSCTFCSITNLHFVQVMELCDDEIITHVLSPYSITDPSIFDSINHSSLITSPSPPNSTHNFHPPYTPNLSLILHLITRQIQIAPPLHAAFRLSLFPLLRP